MSKKLKFIIPTVLIIIVVVLVFGAKSKESPVTEEVNSEVRDELFTSVTTEKIETKSFSVIKEYSGYTSSSESRDVIAKASGEITSFNYKVGDKVSSNDTIAVVDKERYNLILEKVQIGVSNAKLTLDIQEENFNRSKTLYEAASISKVEYESAEFSYKQAENSYKMALNDEASAKINLRNTSIKAGQSGVIASKKVNEGEVINQGMAVASIVNLSSIMVNISVPEEAVVNISRGNEASISIPSLDLENITGAVHTVSPVPNSSNTYDVEIMFENEYGVLSGMRTNVSVKGKSEIEGLVIPQKGVILSQGIYHVWTEENGAAKRHEIKITDKLEGYYLIDSESDFGAGDEIIVDGNSYLDVGDKIKIVNK